MPERRPMSWAEFNRHCAQHRRYDVPHDAQIRLDGDRVVFVPSRGAILRRARGCARGRARVLAGAMDCDDRIVIGDVLE